MTDGITWFEIITIIIAVLALGVSIWSTKYSHAANKLSQEALSHAKHSFIEEQRPHIQLDSTIKDGIVLHCQKIDNKLNFNMNIEVTNTGKTSAHKLVMLKDEINLGMTGIIFDGKSKGPLSSLKSISPGQNFFYVRKFIFTPNNPSDFKQILADWNNGIIFMTADIILKYTDISSKHEYEVSASYKLFKNRGEIIHYNDS